MRERARSGLPVYDSELRREYEKLDALTSSQRRTLVILLKTRAGEDAPQVLSALLDPPYGRYRPESRVFLTELAAAALRSDPVLAKDPFLRSSLFPHLIAPRDIDGLPVAWVLAYGRVVSSVASAGTELFDPRLHTYAWIKSRYAARPELERQPFIAGGGSAAVAFAFTNLSQGQREAQSLNLIDPESKQRLRLAVREQLYPV